MNGRISEFVSRLSEAEMREIHEDQLRFERDGHIGDCALRNRGDELMKELGANETGVTIWMRELITEIWRQRAAPTLSSDEDVVIVKRDHLSRLVQLVRDAMEDENEFMNEWDVEARDLLKEIRDVDPTNDA
jgi:hypothetical protein